MNNEIFIDEQEITLSLSKDIIAKIFNEEKNDEFCREFNSSLGDILLLKDNSFYTDNKAVIDSNIDVIKEAVKTLTKPYREYLNKYFLSDNLNIFLSNGCSIYSGSKAINQNDDDYAKILSNIRPRDFTKIIRGKIESLKESRPEQILDQLTQIRSYLANVEKSSKHVKRIEQMISQIKMQFLSSCVIPIDYTINDYHKYLLKKIVSRPLSLDKVNIFTINYDLLIEKTAEELEIVVNNGFVGFHNRTFMPSAFKLGLFTKESTSSKHFPRIINLFKLHGSISWRFNEIDQNNLYGLEEVQLPQNKIEKAEELPDCLIYPIQHKKRHSLDLPYSELLRQFVEYLHKPNSALIVIGYSFLDEHINDLILNALLNPDFHLIIFSFQNKNELSQDQIFLRRLIERSKNDSRITIFTGHLLGSFENIVKYIMPYIEEKDYQQVIMETVKDIRDGLREKK